MLQKHVLLTSQVIGTEDCLCNYQNVWSGMINPPHYIIPLLISKQW